MTDKTIKRRIGDYGEDIAVEYLKEENYRILDRNYLKPFGEIDIIAIKKGVVSFIEVKTRNNSNYAYASESVNYYKQQRIIRAAKFYLMEKKLSDYLITFDVCEVYTDTGEINYIENAFG